MVSLTAIVRVALACALVWPASLAAQSPARARGFVLVGATHQTVDNAREVGAVVGAVYESPPARGVRVRPGLQYAYTPLFSSGGCVALVGIDCADEGHPHLVLADIAAAWGLGASLGVPAYALAGASVLAGWGNEGFDGIATASPLVGIGVDGRRQRLEATLRTGTRWAGERVVVIALLYGVRL